MEGERTWTDGTYCTSSGQVDLPALPTGASVSRVIVVIETHTNQRPKAKAQCLDSVAGYLFGNHIRGAESRPHCGGAGGGSEAYFDGISHGPAITRGSLACCRVRVSVSSVLSRRYEVRDVDEGG